MKQSLNLLCILLLVLLFSCSGKREGENSATETPKDTLTKAQDLSMAERLEKGLLKLSDTIKGKEHTYYIIPITWEEFNNLNALPNHDLPKIMKVNCSNNIVYCPEELEAARITDTNLVKREGLTLKLRLNDSIYQTWVSSRSDSEGTEGGEYMLVNNNNGDTTAAIGYPATSPNGDNIICSNYDMEAGYTSNGFQILTIRNGKLKKDVLYETEDWGPTKAEWIDNNTIRVIQTIPIHSEKTESEDRYCKIIIK